MSNLTPHSSPMQTTYNYKSVSLKKDYSSLANHETLNVVVFSGGRGATSITTALNKINNFKLSVLVNAYDDGLSTGRLRGFIPGMLGPSDVRKNISSLMPQVEGNQKALKKIIEYRLPVGISLTAGRKIINTLENLMPSSEVDELNNLHSEITLDKAHAISYFCKTFIDYEKVMSESGNLFDYGDCSIGNIIFSGIYLAHGSDFNLAIKYFSDFAGLESQVLNVTDGSNFVLMGIKRDGVILKNEAEIVSPNGDDPVEEIYLLEDYLTPAQLEKINFLDFVEKKHYLNSLAKLPAPNEEALNAIKNADIIIYGPGTQFSSLFPSYLTQSIGSSIILNRKAVKIFIANIGYDHDIKSQTISGLLRDFHYYMCKGSKDNFSIEQLITKVFAQEPDYLDLNRNKQESYIPIDIENSSFPEGGVFRVDWERAAGGHSGSLIADQVLGLIEERLTDGVSPVRHTVSIVVPALNEIKTINKVLSELASCSFDEFKLEKEIIVVDGGSNDGTLEAAMEHPLVRVYSSTGTSKGRGSALRVGVAKAKGDIIVFFPSDDEYDVADIKHLIAPLINNEYSIVFGSRVMKCFSFEDVSSKIYGSHKFNAFLSKYGGLLLSFCCLLKCNRFITDTLTTLKAFDAKTLRQMNLVSSGVDLETELIVRASTLHKFILEVPVSYRPRDLKAGKKITAIDGLGALWRIFRA